MASNNEVSNIRDRNNDRSNIYHSIEANENHIDNINQINLEIHEEMGEENNVINEVL
jgi:hypothetical protein